MIAKSGNIEKSAGPRSGPAWADAWHLWTVIIPRRSISGRLVGDVGPTKNSSSIQTMVIAPSSVTATTQK